MTDVDALAERHRMQQVALAGRLQAALGQTFERYLSPADLDRSFPRYVERAAPILAAGRTLSARMAARYFEEARARAGHPTRDAPPITAPEMKAAQALVVLRVTGPVEIKRRVGAGEGIAAAVRAAEALTLKDTKRLILNGGRDALRIGIARDPRGRGWARTSDGNPCHFCAMLISRGPVYTEQSGSFRAHGGCGCGVRLIFDGDRTDGWSPEARAMRELWNDSGRNLRDFRSTLRRQYRDADSPVSRAFAERDSALS